MIVEMRCIYIEKKNPIVLIETLEKVFDIIDFNPNEMDTGYLYPIDAFNIIEEHDWILESTPTEEDIGNDILGYVFIKKI